MAFQGFGSRAITVERFMAAPMFECGMMEYRLGEKFEEPKLEEQAIQYERGRQFAAATGLYNLGKKRGRVPEELVLRYTELRKDGTIR